MKLSYLMASLLACLVYLNSCSSDSEEPDKNVNANKSTTLVLNVEKPGTFKQLLKKQLPEYIRITGELHSYNIDTLIIKGELNATDLHVLHNYKEEFEDAETYWDDTIIVLDLFDTQIVGSDYNGKNYEANHLYSINGKSFGEVFKVIKFPQNIEVIEAEALQYTHIYDRTLFTREKLHEIEDRAFYHGRVEYSEGPIDIEFSKNLKKIGKEAFESFPIESIKISPNVAIGNYAFRDSEIKRIDLEGVERIGNYTFEDCMFYSMSSKDLYIVSMPDVKYIGDCAFKGNTLLKINPEDLNNLIEIGDSAFYDLNPSSTSIDLSKADKLTKIGEYAFARYYGSKEPLIIPQNVKEIGERAFSGGIRSVVHMKCKTPPVYLTSNDNSSGTNRFVSCDTLYVPKGSLNIYMEGAEEVNSGTNLSCGIHLRKSAKIIEE